MKCAHRESEHSPSPFTVILTNTLSDFLLADILTSCYVGSWSHKRSNFVRWFPHTKRQNICKKWKPVVQVRWMSSIFFCSLITSMWLLDKFEVLQVVRLFDLSYASGFQVQLERFIQLLASSGMMIGTSDVYQSCKYMWSHYFKDLRKNSECFHCQF